MEKTEPYPRSSHHEKSLPVTHTAGFCYNGKKMKGVSALKKAFAFGCILAAAAYAAGFVLPFGFDGIFGAVTAVLIITAIIVSGLAVSGAEQRANYHSETKEGRHARLKMAAVFFCAALPSAVCLLITLL
ncbi:hypothetical protein DALLNEIH_01912 [Bacillus sp. B01(2024)]|nr:uncharacterized protein SRCM100169_00883 [Bacillus siamensis]